MWTEGTIRVGTSVFHYWVKHYEEPSIYGYEEGRVKLSITLDTLTARILKLSSDSQS